MHMRPFEVHRTTKLYIHITLDIYPETKGSGRVEFSLETSMWVLRDPKNGIENVYARRQ